MYIFNEAWVRDHSPRCQKLHPPRYIHAQAGLNLHSICGDSAKNPIFAYNQLIIMRIFNEAWPPTHWKNPHPPRYNRAKFWPKFVQYLRRYVRKIIFNPTLELTCNYAHRPTEEVRQPYSFCTTSDPKAYLCKVWSGSLWDPPSYRTHKANIAAVVASLCWSRMHMSSHYSWGRLISLVIDAHRLIKVFF
jgi:hypothetical protein